MYLGTGLQALGAGAGDWAKMRQQRDEFAAINALRQSQLEANRDYRTGLEGDRQFRNQAYADTQRENAQTRQENALREMFPGMVGPFSAIAAMQGYTTEPGSSMPITGTEALSHGAAAALAAQRKSGDPASFTVRDPDRGGDLTFTVPGREFSPNSGLSPGEAESERLAAQQKFGVLPSQLIRERQDVKLPNEGKYKNRQDYVLQNITGLMKPTRDPNDASGMRWLPGMPADRAMEYLGNIWDTMNPTQVPGVGSSQVQSSPGMRGTLRTGQGAVGALGEGVNQDGQPSTGRAGAPSSRPTATSAPSPGAASKPDSSYWRAKYHALREQGLSMEAAFDELHAMAGSP